MIDLVEHMPLKHNMAPTPTLRQQALDIVEARAARLGYEIAGEVRFRLIVLPLSTYLECRAPASTANLEKLILNELRGIKT